MDALKNKCYDIITLVDLRASASTELRNSVFSERAEEPGDDYNPLEFTGVKRDKGKRRKDQQKVSEPCMYNFCWHNGLDCRFQHTVEENYFFRANNRQGMPGYKSTACMHHLNKKCHYKRRVTCAALHILKRKLCATDLFVVFSLGGLVIRF